VTVIVVALLFSVLQYVRRKKYPNLYGNGYKSNIESISSNVTKVIVFLSELSNSVVGKGKSEYGSTFRLKMPYFDYYHITTDYKLATLILPSNNSHVISPLFKFQAPIFSHMNISHMNCCLYHIIHQFDSIIMKQAKDINKNTFELSEPISRFIFDITTMLLFGKNYNCIASRRDGLILMLSNNIILNHISNTIFQPYLKYMFWSSENKKFKLAEKDEYQIFKQLCTDHKTNCDKDKAVLSSSGTTHVPFNDINNVNSHSSATNDQPDSTRHNDNDNDNDNEEHVNDLNDILNTFMDYPYDRDGQRLSEMSHALMETHHTVSHTIVPLLLEVSTDSYISATLQREIDTHFPLDHISDMSSSESVIEMLLLHILEGDGNDNDDTNSTSKTSALEKKVNLFAKKFPYLDACISETMRLWPLYGIGTLHKVDRDIQYSDISISKNSIVHIAHHCMNSQSWINNKKIYYPSRWLEQSKNNMKENKSDQDDANTMIDGISQNEHLKLLKNTFPIEWSNQTENSSKIINDERFLVTKYLVFVIAIYLFRLYDFKLMSNISVTDSLKTLRIRNMLMRVTSRIHL
jgi:hypothetical protein